MISVGSRTFRSPPTAEMRRRHAILKMIVGSFTESENPSHVSARDESEMSSSCMSSKRNRNSE